MSTISVLSPPEAGRGYRAISDGHEASGDTPGRALDALVEQTGPPPGATMVIIQPKAGDEFFTEAQRLRLGELLALQRTVRGNNTSLPLAEQSELDALIADELKAAIARSAALLRAARP